MQASPFLGSKYRQQTRNTLSNNQMQPNFNRKKWIRAHQEKNLATPWGERESHYRQMSQKPVRQGFTSQETRDLFQALNSHDTRMGHECHKNQKLQ